MPLSELVRGFLDFFLPNRCLECAEPVNTNQVSVPICEDHRQSLTPLRPPLCFFCSRPLSGGLHRHYQYEISDEPICGACRKRSLILNQVVAGFPFRGVLRSVVSDWKYYSNPEWSPWLAEKLVEVSRDRIDEAEWNALVPVPMHWRHRNERGFNQALQLAEALGDRVNMDVLHVLSKTRRTSRQSELARQERLKNLDGAFALNEKELPSSVSSVLVVDDIYTTGSTLRTAAKVLHNHGVSKTGGLVLARTLPND